MLCKYCIIIAHLDEVLDLPVDGGLLVVGAHGETGDLAHQSVVGDTAHHGAAGALGAAGTEESQVLRERGNTTDGERVVLSKKTKQRGVQQ